MNVSDIRELEKRIDARHRFGLGRRMMSEPLLRPGEENLPGGRLDKGLAVAIAPLFCEALF